MVNPFPGDEMLFSRVIVRANYSFTSAVRQVLEASIGGERGQPLASWEKQRRMQMRHITKITWAFRSRSDRDRVGLESESACNQAECLIEEAYLAFDRVEE